MSNKFFSGLLLLRIGLLIPFLTATVAFDLKSQTLNPNKELSQLTHDKWGDEQDYISGGSLSVIQDKNGYLWTGTFNGVFRFDGVRFKQFSKESDSIIINNNVTTLCNGIGNNVWAGSNGGGLYLFDNGIKRNYTTNDGLASNIIRAIYLDTNDRLLIGTPNGLSVLENGKLSNFDRFIIEKDTIDNAVIGAITQLEDNQIILGTNLGLFKFVEPYFYPVSAKEQVIQTEITSVLETKDNSVLIGTYGEGIYQLQDGEISSFTLPNGINKISHLMEDSNGAIWISHQAGLIRYFQGSFSALPSTNGNYEDAVEKVIEDREGSIWLTRYNGGLERLKDGLFYNISTYEGLSDNVIHCIYEDKDNSKWVGTGKGLNHIKGKVITQYTVDNGQILGNLVRDVFRDSKDRLWIATYSGLTKIIGDKITHYTVKDGLSSNLTRLVFEDSKGRLWIGTRNGLNRYEDGKFIQYGTEEGISNNFILSLLETENGAIWIGTSGGGINILENGRFSQFTTKDGLPSNVVFRMHQDKEGAIWIATNNGLCKYENSQFYSHFKTDKGYLNAALYQVLEDKNNALWITSDFGIIKVKKSELNQYLIEKNQNKISEIHYKQLDGLKRSECTGAARSIVASDEKLWFATLGSVAIINVDDSLYNDMAPPVVIEEIIADNELIANQEVSQIDKNTKTLTINYTALSLKIPSKVKFKYRLIGFDNEWVSAQNKRSVSYQNLSPGDYTFEMKASNNDGVWSKKTALKTFYIVPKLYQTTPFYLACILLFCFLVFGINTIRIRRIKREKVKLQQLIDERTSEVTAQNEEISAQRDKIEERSKKLEEAQDIIKLRNNELRSSNISLEETVKKRTQELEKTNTKLQEKNRDLDLFIYKSAHDLRGPIARIQGLILLGQADSANSSLYFNKLEFTATHMSQLLARTIRVHNLNSRVVEKQKLNLNEFLNSILIENDFLGKVEILNMPPKGYSINSDPYLLKIAIQNLLENSIKFSSQEQVPKIVLSFFENKDNIIFRISNNGISIPAAFNSKIFEIFTVANDKKEGSGLGLYEAKVFMEKLNSSINLIHSTKEETVFEIIIPNT